MNTLGTWLVDIADDLSGTAVDGLVAVNGFIRDGQLPEVVAVMEAAERYEADAVFFEAAPQGKPPVAQAFLYKEDGPLEDSFGILHKKLWSWGGVPLVYRVSPGVVHLFRCAHGPDFEGSDGPVAHPFDTWKTATDIALDPWWNAERLRNGTLWDDPTVCADLLSRDKAAQKSLIDSVWKLHNDLGTTLPRPIRRRLLILSVLIAYLEAREVLDENFFKKFDRKAERYFDVLPNAPALLAMLEELETRFNGGVFSIRPEEREVLLNTNRLDHFAQILDNKQSGYGQWRIWDRYSFADLPVELISHIYQLFVADSSVAVYTPHFVVRLMVGEALSMARMDRLQANDEVILDAACGSGVFLVEAYKRLILHWRARNEWRSPTAVVLKEILVKRIRGVDIEPGAVELASFSLCLAICDALDKDVLKKSRKLFPMLIDGTVEASCFFEAVEEGKIDGRVGVVLGNPPFVSKLTTDGAKRAGKTYKVKHGKLPDNQLAYLFLHASMEILVEGGILSMVQQYNFLYNKKSKPFREKFMSSWDIREILDFISIRGLFHKGGADTKALVIVAEANKPNPNRALLHATFRRSGRADAEQGFDIDHYDLHWMRQEAARSSDVCWRSNLLGGGRVNSFAERLSEFPTLKVVALENDWDIGEGYIVATGGRRNPASHITNQRTLPSDAIGEDGVDPTRIRIEHASRFRSSYSPRRFTPPMVLIHEQFNLNHDLWTESYLTYQNQIVGVSGGQSALLKLKALSRYLTDEKKALQAYVAATSVKLFTQHATTLSGADVYNLPYPSNVDLELTEHERIIIDDVVDFYRDLIRKGEKSAAMKEPGVPALPAFNDIYTNRINLVYRNKQLRPLAAQTWSGVVCQPFVFGKGSVDWRNGEELKDKLDALLMDKRSSGLNLTRIVRLYDGPFIFLMKPDRLRYWLRSIALRDADETLVELAQQGF